MTTLTLTDGTTSANLIDGTNYQVVKDGWSPRVANPRRSKIGGRSMYENVTENIQLWVYGANAAGVYDNVQKLRTLLTQAEQFFNGARVASVSIRYQPVSSGLGSYVSATVIGGSIDMPRQPDDSINTQVLVNMTIVREGLWLGAGESDTATISSGGTDQVRINSLTFSTNTTEPGPLYFTIAHTTTSNAAGDSFSDNISGYVLMATDSAHLQLYQGEAAASGLTGTTTYGRAVGNSVGYLRTGGASSAFNVYYTISGFTTNSREIAVVMSYWNRSSTTSWDVQLTPRTASAGISPGNSGDTLTRNIPTGGASGKGFLIFDYVQIPDDLNEIMLFTFTPTNPVAGTGDDLEIDYFYVIARDNRNARVIYLLDEGYQSDKTWTVQSTGRPIRKTRAYLTVDGAGSLQGSNQDLTYRGDTYMEHWGNTLAFAVALTTGNTWQVEEDGTNALGGMALTVGKTLGYPVPE